MREVHEIFTEQALRAFIAADEHAGCRGSDPVESVHLLLGLVAPFDGAPDERIAALVAAGGVEIATLAQVAAEPLAMLVPVAPHTRQGYLDRDVKAAIERAVRESQALAAPQVDTTHLFLGLMGAQGGSPRTILAQFGLCPEMTRTIVRTTPARFTPPTPDSLWGAIRPSPIFLALLTGTALAGAALLSDPSPSLSKLLTIIFIVCGWLVSLCLHEFGHCLAAYLGGDRGVVGRGGLTLDPRRYGHPLLTFALPLLVLLGGSIGLPGGVALIDHAALRSRRWEVAVALGGPCGTLLCVVLVALPFFWFDANIGAFHGTVQFWSALAGLGWAMSSVLILTLLPIPPLDGFNLIAPWLPARMRDQGYQLGWAPLILLYAVLAQGNPVSDLYWASQIALLDWLHIPPELARYGYQQLRFR